MKPLFPILAFLATATALAAQSAAPAFTFEGDVEHADPALRAELGPPRVLAGTFTLQGVEATYDELIPGVTHYNDTVRHGEFTLDRNYVVNCAGAQTEGDNLATIINGEAHEENDRVMVAWTLSSEPLPASGYVARRLTLILDDEDGAMLDSAALIQTAPAFQTASFALDFVNPETGEEATLTGALTVFADWQREVTPAEDYRQLEEQIRELDALLVTKDARIATLQTELARAQEAARAREEKLAALEAERESWATGEAVEVLEGRNDELQAQLEASQAAREFSAGAVAQMTVRHEWLANDNAELATRNAQLREELAASLAETGKLRTRLEAIAREAEALAAARATSLPAAPSPVTPPATPSVPLRAASSPAPSPAKAEPEEVLEDAGEETVFTDTVTDTDDDETDSPRDRVRRRGPRR